VHACCHRLCEEQDEGPAGIQVILLFWSTLWGPEACRGFLLHLVQVQSTQRNIATNAQRRFVSSFGLADGYEGGAPLLPSFPVELKDVSLLSVSPSGVPTNTSDSEGVWVPQAPSCIRSQLAVAILI